ncbi:MAG: hypothetical protein H0X71_05630, partial [Rubrobacter sp.]|nr:hypothetical protein [Rubrobacter sp.]
MLDEGTYRPAAVIVLTPLEEAPSCELQQQMLVEGVGKVGVRGTDLPNPPIVTTSNSYPFCRSVEGLTAKEIRGGSARFVGFGEDAPAATRPATADFLRTSRPIKHLRPSTLSGAAWPWRPRWPCG